MLPSELYIALSHIAGQIENRCMDVNTARRVITDLLSQHCGSDSPVMSRTSVYEAIELMLINPNSFGSSIGFQSLGLHMNSVTYEGTNYRLVYNSDNESSQREATQTHSEFYSTYESALLEQTNADAPVHIHTCEIKLRNVYDICIAPGGHADVEYRGM